MENVKADNTVYVATLQVGKCTIECTAGIAEVNFGSVLPSADEKGHVVKASDVPYFYTGAENVYIKANGGNSGLVSVTCVVNISDES